MIAPARVAFLASDKIQPIFDFKPMQDYLGASPPERSFRLALLGLFGALARLAAVGIYGVITYRSVCAHASWEFAWRSVPSGGMYFGWYSCKGQAHRVKSWGIATSFVVAVFLGTVALVASYVPARRATIIDPMMALRYK